MKHERISIRDIAAGIAAFLAAYACMFVWAL